MRETQEQNIRSVGVSVMPQAIQADPISVPSWLLWKLLLPLLFAIISGGIGFIAWSTPKIITSEERNLHVIKTQDAILSELREIRKELSRKP